MPASRIPVRSDLALKKLLLRSWWITFKTKRHAASNRVASLAITAPCVVREVFDPWSVGPCPRFGPSSLVCIRSERIPTATHFRGDDLIKAPTRRRTPKKRGRHGAASFTKHREWLLVLILPQRVGIDLWHLRRTFLSLEVRFFSEAKQFR
jgi:hypothetical protein